MRMIVILIMLLSFGCAGSQFAKTVGGYAGTNLKMDVRHGFINNGSSGGKKEGHFFPGYTERDETWLNFGFEVLLRPE